MAEAHQAVAFPFVITNDGWDVNVDREVLKLVWRSGLRSWKRQFARFMNNVQNGVYPAHLWSLWLFMSIVIAIHYSGYVVLGDVIGTTLPYLPGTDSKWKFVDGAIVAVCMWLGVVYLIRYTLKFLFMYKGWMYEVRGKSISSKTKAWITLVRILSSFNKPKLFSLQGSLPKLPVPSLKSTMERYMQSIRPLVDDENYERIKKMAESFEKGIGPKLQRYLILKSWWSTNYVADWWEEYVYLRARSPLMINSNFYGMDALVRHPTKSQAARAASIINTCFMFKRMIERQELKPLLIQNSIPLCSSQYERLFNTTRIPGLETDQIVHWKDSNHVAIYYRGRYYKVIIKTNKILNAREIQEQIQQIIDDPYEPLPAEKKLGALTASNRTEWAQIRRSFFNTGVNRTSLDAIEKAAFFMSLDDVPYISNPEIPEELDTYGKLLLHGNGYNRWFDKSINVCVSSNGKMGVNCEHSWGDAPIPVQLWEYMIWQEIENRFAENGDVIGKIETIPPPPIRLQWEIKPDVEMKIQNAVENAQKLIHDLDLHVFAYREYGKGFIKTCKVSPDAFIQMAIQLTYYRDAGKFSLTYEACMTRLYKDGRTETVRPCTVESSSWVKAMENKNTTVNERIKLLRTACKRHQRNYLDAMCGKGVDRHLFCLYVVSKYLEIESPFLQEVLNEPWRLSTSQSPLEQMGFDFKKHPECLGTGGGFGPVDDDGYGVSYIITGENTIFFHISNKKSSKLTDCHRFGNRLREVLNNMQDLFTIHNDTTEQSK